MTRRRLNLLGQVAGVASTEWGLSGMILAAATISTDGNYVASAGHQMGVYCFLLVVHGIMNVRLVSLVRSSPSLALARA